MVCKLCPDANKSRSRSNREWALSVSYYSLSHWKGPPTTRDTRYATRNESRLNAKPQQVTGQRETQIQTRVKIRSMSVAVDRRVHVQRPPGLTCSTPHDTTRHDTTRHDTTPHAPNAFAFWLAICRCRNSSSSACRALGSLMIAANPSWSL